MANVFIRSLRDRQGGKRGDSRVGQGLLDNWTADFAGCRTCLTSNEIELIIRDSPKGKRPGPDGIPMEFYKWLNEEMKLEVLDILNLIWRNNWFLETMEEANVVTLYKKGNVEDPANYRPISLLQSIYKIYAVPSLVTATECHPSSPTDAVDLMVCSFPEPPLL